MTNQPITKHMMLISLFQLNNMYNINKFFYEHITGKSYDEYVNYLKAQGFALEVPKNLKD